jgi:hypothetical protein
MDTSKEMAIPQLYVINGLAVKSPNPNNRDNWSLLQIARARGYHQAV